MFFIEPFEFAPKWLQDAAKVLISQASDGPGPRVLEPCAVAFFRIYGENTSGYPQLRDRSEEVRKMLLGLAGGLKTCTSGWTGTGLKFRDLGTGFEPVGAQYGNTFHLMVA